MSGAHGGQKGTPDSLELELQGPVNHCACARSPTPALCKSIRAVRLHHLSSSQYFLVPYLETESTCQKFVSYLENVTIIAKLLYIPSHCHAFQADAHVMKQSLPEQRAAPWDFRETLKAKFKVDNCVGWHVETLQGPKQLSFPWWWMQTTH